jgi:hypothetical protein
MDWGRCILDPMAFEPQTFRDIVEADLRRAARLVIKVQDDIDPQFRIATQEGDYWLAVTLPAEAIARNAMLRRIGTFLVWKQATAFTLACELVDPDCVYCVGIAGRERHACLARVRRHPKPWTAASLGTVEWLPDTAIDPVIAALLPNGPRSLTPKDVAAAEKWFGRDGRFPAVHIATGELRGLG